MVKKTHFAPTCDASPHPPQGVGKGKRGAEYSLARFMGGGKGRFSQQKLLSTALRRVEIDPIAKGINQRQHPRIPLISRR
jgi:hypothetical protein